jgi:hypothetical protein
MEKLEPLPLGEDVEKLSQQAEQKWLEVMKEKTERGMEVT